MTGMLLAKSESEVSSQILAHLQDVPGAYRARIEQTLEEPLVAREEHHSYDPGLYSAKSSLEHAAVCLSMVRAITTLEGLREDQRHFLLLCLGEYVTGDGYMKQDGVLEALRDVAIDGLYEYLDE